MTVDLDTVFTSDSVNLFAQLIATTTISGTVAECETFVATARQAELQIDAWRRKHSGD